MISLVSSVVCVYLEMIVLGVVYLCFFFFKQKTAYEMRISDWSSDVCSSDLLFGGRGIDQVSEAMRSRGIELVISDSEAWTHRVAQRLNLPRISFDHVGIIAYCKPHFPPDLWALGDRKGVV